MNKTISTFLLSAICSLSYGQASRNLYGFTKTNAISVTQNGNSLPHAWAGGINSAQVSTMDLDLDGTSDLVLFDRQGKNFHTYLAVGSGSSAHYEYAPQYEENFPMASPLTSWAFLRDYNCDGKKDLFFSEGSYFYVWENTSGSTLSFTPANNGQKIKSIYNGNTSNLYVNSANIPGIIDINNDGAIDLLTYVNGGIEMEYHKGQTPCGLNFELEETCWGHFTETGFTRGVDLNNCTPRRKSTMHDGSTILPLDLDNDQVKDLILGNISFSTMTAVYNGGDLDSAHMSSQDTAYPSNNPIDIPFFPGAFYEDVDFDNTPDLLASPAVATSEAVNKKSLYLYKNTGSTASPSFSLQTEDFIQGKMIDLGERAVPRLADLNGDSLLDLIVSNSSYRLKDSLNIHTYYYYENTGTSTQPAFTLVDSNFMDISSYGIEGSIPAFGDLDGDGDLDAIIGERNGDIHYFKNSSSTNPSFTLAMAGIATLQGNFAAPFLYDIDSNGTLDLLVGNEVGTVHHFANSSPSSPSFTLKDSRFGGITTKGSYTYGYSIPYLFRNNGVDNIFVGSFNSGIFQFDSIKQVINTPSVLDPTIGTGNIASNNSDDTPFGIKRKNGRNQILIRADEMRASGLVFGYINGISFKVTTSQNNIIEHLYIKVKNTNDSVLNNFESGFTTVVSDIRDQPQQGWHYFKFNNPFLWDGASGIVIEICFSGQPNSKDIHIEMTDVGFNANAYGDYVDQTLQGNGCAQPYLNNTTLRPNMRINLTPSFANTENYGQGIYTAPAVGDLDGDGFLDMIVGNMNGGLSYYQGKIYDVGLPEPKHNGVFNLNVFPNPGNGAFTVNTQNTGQAEISVFDLSGKLILRKEVNSAETKIDLQNQPSGMYLFIMQSKGKLKTAKVIKR